jgi:hypothetical protein
MKNKTIDKWNAAWDNDTITLSVNPLNKTTLEGKTEKDKDLVRRALGAGRVRDEPHYNALLKIVSEWGYCVETPADFNFPTSFATH